MLVTEDEPTGDSVTVPVTVDVGQRAPRLRQDLRALDPARADDVRLAPTAATPTSTSSRTRSGRRPRTGPRPPRSVGSSTRPTTASPGTDTFTYTATDGIECSLPATVTVEVVNHAPECFDDIVQLRTGKPLDDVLLVQRPGRARRSRYSIVDPPDHGGATIGTDGFTYTPAAGFTGADHFTIRANDGFDDSAPVRIDLDVTPNHAPVSAATFTRHTGVGDALELDLFCFDQDSQDSSDLTYALAAPSPAHGTITGFQPGARLRDAHLHARCRLRRRRHVRLHGVRRRSLAGATQRIHVSDSRCARRCPPARSGRTGASPPTSTARDRRTTSGR